MTATLAPVHARRSDLVLSVAYRQLFVSTGAHAPTTAVHTHRIGD